MGNATALINSTCLQTATGINHKGDDAAVGTGGDLSLQAWVRQAMVSIDRAALQQWHVSAVCAWSRKACNLPHMVFFLLRLSPSCLLSYPLAFQFYSTIFRSLAYHPIAYWIMPFIYCLTPSSSILETQTKPKPKPYSTLMQYLQSSTGPLWSPAGQHQQHQPQSRCHVPMMSLMLETPLQIHSKQQPRKVDVEFRLQPHDRSLSHKCSFEPVGTCQAGRWLWLEWSCCRTRWGSMCENVLLGCKRELSTACAATQGASNSSIVRGQHWGSWLWSGVLQL